MSSIACGIVFLTFHISIIVGEAMRRVWTRDEHFDRVALVGLIAAMYLCHRGDEDATHAREIHGLSDVFIEKKI